MCSLQDVSTFFCNITREYSFKFLEIDIYEDDIQSFAIPVEIVNLISNPSFQTSLKLSPSFFYGKPNKLIKAFRNGFIRTFQ